MLYNLKSSMDYTICSKDGTIGKIKDVLFDDRKWVIKYLVADTGNWLKGNKVLISPEYMLELNREKQCINVDLLKKEVSASPPETSDLPVNRQIEKDFFQVPESAWSAYFLISNDKEIISDINHRASEERRAEMHSWDSHLRSAMFTKGVTFEATDGDIGVVEDFIIDSVTWAIRYLIVNTGKWWEGHKVLVAPPWIDKMSWGTLRVHVNIEREVFKTLEEFTSIEMLTREYEDRLHQSCNRIGYWADDTACKIEGKQ